MTRVYSSLDPCAGDCPAWISLLSISFLLRKHDIAFYLLGEWAINATIKRITNGDIELLIPEEASIPNVGNHLFTLGFTYAGASEHVTVYERYGLHVYLWQGDRLRRAIGSPKERELGGYLFLLPDLHVLPTVLQLQFSLQPSSCAYRCDPIKDVADLLIVYPESFSCVPDVIAAQLARRFRGYARDVL